MVQTKRCLLVRAKRGPPMEVRTKRGPPMEVRGKRGLLIKQGVNLVVLFGYILYV